MLLGLSVCLSAKLLNIHEWILTKLAGGIGRGPRNNPRNEFLKGIWAYIADCINSVLLPARRYASAGLCDSDVSVRPSVRHTPVLCLAERKQDREMYTI